MWNGRPPQAEHYRRPFPTMLRSGHGPASPLNRRGSGITNLRVSRRLALLNDLRKPRVLVNLSLFLSWVLLIFIVVDFAAIFRERPEECVPRGWQTSIFFIHIAAFYMLLAGYVYSNEAGDHELIGRAKWSLLVNAVAYILRISFEINFMDFFPQEFS